MAEVLGILSACITLAECGVAVITALQSISRNLHHMEAAISHHIKITRQVVQTALLIKHNPELQTALIHTYIDSTLSEASALQTSLEQLSSFYSKDKRLRRLYRITLKGSSDKKHILDQFSTIEKRQGALVLCITVLHADKLANIQGGIETVITWTKEYPQKAQTLLGAATTPEESDIKNNLEGKQRTKVKGEKKSISMSSTCESASPSNLRPTETQLVEPDGKGAEQLEPQIAQEVITDIGVQIEPDKYVVHNNVVSEDAQGMIAAVLLDSPGAAAMVSQNKINGAQTVAFIGIIDNKDVAANAFSSVFQRRK